VKNDGRRRFLVLQLAMLKRGAGHCNENNDNRNNGSSYQCELLLIPFILKGADALAQKNKRGDRSHPVVARSADD